MKREDDFKKALKELKKAIKYISTLLPQRYSISFVHQEHIKLSPAELKKYNSFFNRFKASDKSVGLEVQFIDNHTGNSVQLRFAYKNGGGFYLKMPSEFTSVWRLYLGFLRVLGYYVIIVEPGKDDSYTFSLPTSLAIYIDHWNPEKQNSKGNRNRIQFHGPLSSVVCMHPYEKNLFGESVITNLIKLVE